jgi:hypothetical protein
MERTNQFAFTSRWTMEDAKRAGLVKADSGWVSYPENMCMWRAIGFCADVVAPDVTAGLTAFMKMPEKFGAAIDDSGDLVIDGNFKETPVSAPAAAPLMSLEQILNLVGPDAVLAANDGKFPETDEEVNTLVMKLGGVK